MTRLTTEFESRKMSVITAVKQAYTFQGWRFVEVVGRLRDDALPAGCYSSKKTRTIVVSVQTAGAASKKVYSQKDAFFLAVTMQCPTGEHGEDGDTFVLVFSKRRAPNQRMHRTPQ